MANSAQATDNQGTDRKASNSKMMAARSPQPVRVARASRLLAPAIAAAVILLAAIPAFAQPPGEFTGDPVELVRHASQNELNSSNTAPHPYRYVLHKSETKGSTTKEIIETRDGDVARLIQRNDKPLTADEQKAELDRLQNLMDHPEVQEHRHKREKEDSEHANKIVKVLPDAFLFTYAGMVAGPNGPAIRLTFVPNPKFDPPDHEAMVLHGMAGELWIDQAQERMVKLDAHLVSDVEFGWGFLGRLYKGGTILVENADVGDHHWETTHMKLNMSGKALMVKSLDIQTTEDASKFQPVPTQTSYQDAVRLLRADNPVSQVATK